MSDLLIPGGVSLFKVGLAGCGPVKDWQARWAEVISTCRQDSRTDSRTAGCRRLCRLANGGRSRSGRSFGAGIELGCPALLVDTWDKSAGGLFEHWPVESLHDFVRQVHRQHMIVVLAGVARRRPGTAGRGDGPRFDRGTRGGVRHKSERPRLVRTSALA